MNHINHSNSTASRLLRSSAKMPGLHPGLFKFNRFAVTGYTQLKLLDNTLF